MTSKTCVCGMEIGADDQFCPYCGREQHAAQATRPLEAAGTPTDSGTITTYEPYPAEPTTPASGQPYAGTGADAPTTIPERPFYQPQAVGASGPSAGAPASLYGADTYGGGTGNGGATWAQAPARTQTQVPSQNANGTWASGSSFPAANPYAQPNTVSSGTTINGRPANSGGGGVLKGAGAAIAAFFVILAKAGAGLGAALGALGSIGIFKLLFYWLAFRHGSFCAWKYGDSSRDENRKFTLDSTVETASAVPELSPGF